MDKSVLIIDDSRHFAESISELLSEQDWRIEIALNGEEGLARLSAKEFAVVLLDLKMPIMSGLEFLQRLEEPGLTDSIYVIVLTGEITIENAVDSLRLGARDFIQKPAVVDQPEVFVQRIEKGFQWQDQRIIHEGLIEERKNALEESRLIVKSVGHDISGSYFTSLMLRLRAMEKTFARIESELDHPEAPADTIRERIRPLNAESRNRLQGIITLMEFIKELGNKLKHLGEAIAVDEKNMVVLDLSSLARKTLEIYAINRTDIRVQTDYSAKALPILASAEDLNRVLMNMIENALRAMPGGGTLRLRTYESSGQAAIDIEDTGIGIPPEVQDRIWRPDYTNWSGESGTGLGLLICKKVIENHNGTVSLRSAPGQGTTFTIRFRIAREKKLRS